jgi:hypothetical protein
MAITIFPIIQKIKRLGNFFKGFGGHRCLLQVLSHRLCARKQKVQFALALPNRAGLASNWADLLGGSVRNIVLIGLVVVVSGCSGGFGASRLNPVNWFNGQKATVQPGGSLLPRNAVTGTTDTRPLIAQVGQTRLDRTNGGYILTATGLTPQTGYHSVDLVQAVSASAQDLVFDLRALPPTRAYPNQSTTARSVTAAVFLSDSQLIGIRRIRVNAAQNAQNLRR